MSANERDTEDRVRNTANRQALIEMLVGCVALSTSTDNTPGPMSNMVVRVLSIAAIVDGLIASVAGRQPLLVTAYDGLTRGCGHLVDSVQQQYRGMRNRS